jgi:hypothetical protein
MHSGREYRALSWPLVPWRAASAWTVLAAGGVLVGFALRGWVLSSPLGTLESDEAVVGLMALRALGGDFSVFYWGALYGGSQEALLTAVAFAVAGPSTLLLKLVALGVYTVAAALVWLVGRRTIGEPGARLAVAVFWIWPPFFVWWSTKARAYFATGLVIGLTALFLVLRLRERDSRRDAALLGIALGFGVWATLQSMLIALPALGWLAWRRPTAYRLVPYALPGLVIGAAPWIAWNVRHGWNAVVPRAVAGGDSTYLERFGNFFTVVLPTWIGVRAPGSHDWLLGRLVGVTIVVVVLSGFVVLVIRRPVGLEPILVVGAAFPFLYAATSFTFFIGEPRYLVFLGPVIALLAGWALARTTVAVTAVALAALAVASVAGLVGYERQRIYQPGGSTDVAVPADVGPVLAMLEREGVDRVLANYWIAYRLTFESDERVIASPSGFWRYRPYRDAVRADPRPGRVFAVGSRVEPLERARLISQGYRRLRAGDFIVYLP